MSRLRRRLVGGFGLAALIASAAALWGYRNAVAAPIVRRAAFALPGWPTGARPVTVALISDIHIGNATTDLTRVTSLRDRVRDLRPDIVVITGDFVAGHAPGSAATLAGGLTDGLKGLGAPLGVYAVLGNHDHWTGADAVRAALRKADIRLLDNDATSVGPLVLGGIGDDYTGHARLAAMRAAMTRLNGARVAISHSPDVRPRLPADVPLLLAGHTHCGQIVVPWLFTPQVPSRFGERYRCGVVRAGRIATVVTAGTGTSVVPLRFGALPDVWLLTLGPR